MKSNIIVTGGYGVIGKAIAEGLARKGHAIWILGRDENRLQQAKDEIIKNTGNKNITPVNIDLSLKYEIEQFTESWQQPLHVLINNAATTPKERLETEDGIEMQFAVNVLSYFRLIKNLTCIMNSNAPARVINIASYYAGGLRLDDLEFRTRNYNNDAAYRQSKQANRMLTVAFAERLAPLGITVNSCHPGDVNTKLSNSMGFAGSDSPEDSAATPLMLATDPKLENVTGKFFAHHHEQHDEFASDKEAIEKLYQLCECY